MSHVWPTVFQKKPGTSRPAGRYTPQCCGRVGRANPAHLGRPDPWGELGGAACRSTRGSTEEHELCRRDIALRQMFALCPGDAHASPWRTKAPSSCFDKLA